MQEISQTVEKRTPLNQLTILILTGWSIPSTPRVSAQCVVCDVHPAIPPQQARPWTCFQQCKLAMSSPCSPLGLCHGAIYAKQLGLKYESRPTCKAMVLTPPPPSSQVDCTQTLCGAVLQRILAEKSCSTFAAHTCFGLHQG